MIVKNIINEMLPSIWPLIVFISIVAITLRGAYLLKHKKKFVLYKEVLALIFILYILCLYYVLTYQDINYGDINLVPFREMLRYEIGSYKFIRNILGNILLFIPFGFFASYYLNSRNVKAPLIVTLIVTASAEIMQYYIGRVFDIDDIILNIVGGFLGYLLFVLLITIKEKLPKFMKNDSFANFLIIIIIIIIIICAFKINIFDYLK